LISFSFRWDYSLESTYGLDSDSVGIHSVFYYMSSPAKALMRARTMFTLGLCMWVSKVAHDIDGPYHMLMAGPVYKF
jgi:hypothetical protein